jgi:hypothetical protein
MKLPLPEFNAEYNPDMIHILPTIFWMRGEYEQTGEPAGVMLGFSWLGITLSAVWA